MNLPKMYAPVKVRFGSLCWCLGSGGGVSEIDITVIRKARRVIGRHGEWCWQLVLAPIDLKQKNGFGRDDIDQESLNNSDEFEIIDNRHHTRQI